MLVLIGPETKNLLAFQGRRGIASVVRWNPRPVIFGVDTLIFLSLLFLISLLFLLQGISLLF